MHSGRSLLVTYLSVPLDYLSLRGACEDVLTSLEPLDGKQGISLFDLHVRAHKGDELWANTLPVLARR